MSKDLVRAPSRSLPEKQSLADLLARVEAATTENPKLLVGLACDIHAALVAEIPKGYERGSSSGRYLMAHGRGGRTWSEEVPGYCTSIDAALGLVERCLPGAYWRVHRSTPSNTRVKPYFATCGFAGQQELAEGETPPLAILAAFLRALGDGASCASTLGTDAEGGSPGMNTRNAPPPKFPQGREGS